MKNKETKIDISEFLIFEKLHSGPNSLICINKDKPLLSIGKSLISIGNTACKKMGVEKNSLVAVSTREDVIYFCILPMDSKIKGYKIQKYSSSSLYVVSKSLINRGIQKGVYLVGDSLFVGGIDWFELEKFEDE